MRITNSMMINTMMRNLNKSYTRMDKLYQQAATGKRIQVASDDPVAMARILTISSEISASEQYKKNIDTALSWMETTETALTQLKDVIQRVRELTVRGATGSLSDTDKAAIQAEISQLKEQVVAIGNATHTGRYIFAGYQTDVAPFKLVETEMGTKLTYNGKMISPGGIALGVDAADFAAFLENPDNIETTYAQAADAMRIEIGMSNLVTVNITGPELFEKGFGGIFESLTKLENVLLGQEEYMHGFVDMKFSTTLPTSGLDLDNSDGTKTFNIEMGGGVFQLNLPNKNPIEAEDIQKAIDANEYLKKNGVKIVDDGANNFIITADEKFTIKAGTLGTTTDATPAGAVLAPLVVSDRLSGTVSASDISGLEIDDGTTLHTITLPAGATYNLDTLSGRNAFIKDLQNGLPAGMKASFTEDNRLMITGEYGSSFEMTANTAAVALGFTDTTSATPIASATSVIKTEKLDTSAMLDDLDKNLENILGKLSGIGAKTNRLELDQSRLEDTIINLKKLLSKAEDVDMAETIMNFKMEENVYRSALSVGARIIQPTLLDFLR
ncbi:flagellar hook-associated protein FlgL [Geosporobacter ferrireducens]|uniref:Uncharacterized protein n=1 Tax=Geosporobacter ferrireducens TaxID=1424294 RepID=A0A1D8GGJ5_9FIRM|nr:flagellar hook-associated protein FlgL [Geosporobacter ferrireducens]AOT70028.1 hypothetical protein Gferi_10775 [Geosporobacter ferrireducens]MTI53426.1 flagellar hook-associated protein 3 [Geosporobacter ferrireducens]